MNFSFKRKGMFYKQQGQNIGRAGGEAPCVSFHPRHCTLGSRYAKQKNNHLKQ